MRWTIVTQETITKTWIMGLSIENYHHVLIFVWLERISMLWGVLTWRTSWQLCILHHCISPDRWATLLPNDSLHGDCMPTTGRGHALDDVSRPLSLMRWVRVVADEFPGDRWCSAGHQSPMLMPTTTKERPVVHSFAAKEKDMQHLRLDNRFIREVVVRFVGRDEAMSSTNASFVQQV